MRSNTLLKTTTSVLCLLAAAGAAGHAAAQSAATPAPAPSQPPGALSSGDTPNTVDQIVVTAQKRTQSLQDVPIVVTTVNRQLLQDTGVRDIKDLALLTPGLVVTSTSSEASTTARIRGIGTVGDNPGLESSVGIVIDGVYRPRNGVGFGDLGDVDRIEVLKGPQGTLFGKSTSAGVINIITAPPSFKFGASAEATFGNYGQAGGAAQVTGPLIPDVLAGSLYFADRQRDGFFDVNTGQGPRKQDYDNNRDFYTIRGQLLANPSSDLTMRFIADYSHRTERCCMAVVTRQGASLNGAGAPSANQLVNGIGAEGDGSDPYARNGFSNRPDLQNITDGGVSLQVDYKIPSLNATLTSISSWRDWKVTGGFDADFSTADIVYLPTDDSNSTQFRDISQEVRLAGSTGKLDWLVGGFYSNENLRQNTDLRVGSDFQTYISELFSSTTLGAPVPNLLSAFPPLFGAPPILYNSGDGGVDQYRQRDDTYAIFTNDTFHVTDKLELNLGVRYTDDEKVLNTRSFNIGNGAGCAAANVDPLFATPAANETLCLPFLSPGYNNFTDHQAKGEQEWSGTAKVTYRFDPHILVYGSYARGYKPGSFNLDRVQCAVGSPGCAPLSAAVTTPITDTSFPAEFNNSYELGEKATLLNRTLLLNATLFYQEFTNFQLNTFNGLVFVVDSVPKIHSKGIDADFVWFPIRNLSFQGGLTMADTRYALDDAQLAAFVAKTGFQGARGSRLSLAPLYSASFSGTYTYELNDDYRVRFNAGMKFSSDYNTGSDLDPGKIQKDFMVWNGRIVFAPRTDKWSVELFAENLFDKDYKQVAFDSGFQNAPSNREGVLDAFLGAPRTFGVTLRAKY